MFVKSKIILRRICIKLYQMENLNKLKENGKKLEQLQYKYQLNIMKKIMKGDIYSVKSHKHIGSLISNML